MPSNSSPVLTFPMEIKNWETLLFHLQKEAEKASVYLNVYLCLLSLNHPPYSTIVPRFPCFNDLFVYSIIFANLISSSALAFPNTIPCMPRQCFLAPPL